jgi:hypothetical protein
MPDPTGQGGQPGSSGNDDKIVVHASRVVERLAKYAFDNHGKSPGAVALIGYIGTVPGGVADTIRFYADLHLQTYFDIPTSEILEWEQIQRSDGANVSKIVVRGDLALEIKHTATASFLRGGIVLKYSLEGESSSHGDESPKTTCRPTTSAAHKECRIHSPSHR